MGLHFDFCFFFNILWTYSTATDFSGVTLWPKTLINSRIGSHRVWLSHIVWKWWEFDFIFPAWMPSWLSLARWLWLKSCCVDMETHTFFLGPSVGKFSAFFIQSDAPWGFIIYGSFIIWSAFFLDFICAELFLIMKRHLNFLRRLFYICLHDCKL